MLPLVYATSSHVDLQQFVHRSLCEQERFDPDQTVLHQSPLRQGTRIVGMLLRLEGARLHGSQAVWVEAENRILFYNSAGQRFAEVKLVESPDIQSFSSPPRPGGRPAE